MKNNILKKLLLLIPLVILTVTLFFIDHTVRYVKKTAYDFVYNTNVGSVQRFSKEIDELSSEKYGLSDDDGLFTNMIQVYNKTLGEKEALITFLLDENARIIHSNDSNKAYLAAYLDSLENIYSIEQVASAGRSGEIKLLDKNNEKKSARFYYQLLTVGEDRYYLFMGIYRNAIESHLNVHAITIPISVISLLLLIVSENLVWQKMFCIPCDRKKDFKEEG